MTPEKEEEIRHRHTDLASKRIALMGYESDLVQHVGELLEEIGSLRESIRIYGGHCGGCFALEYGGHMNHCTCGFRAVYTKAITKKTDERTESNSDAPKEPGGV